MLHFGCCLFWIWQHELWWIELLSSKAELEVLDVVCVQPDVVLAKMVGVLGFGVTERIASAPSGGGTSSRLHTSLISLKVRFSVWSFDLMDSSRSVSTAWNVMIT